LVSQLNEEWPYREVCSDKGDPADQGAIQS
jgi:hypothetical protein